MSGGPIMNKVFNNSKGFNNSRNLSISDGTQSQGGSSVGKIASPHSKRSGNSRSGMTRNPMHFEDKLLQHVAPGIDDKVSHLYREYDSRGRIS